MVKPPAWGIEGTWTSSHWPGRWVKPGCLTVVSRNEHYICSMLVVKAWYRQALMAIRWLDGSMYDEVEQQLKALGFVASIRPWEMCVRTDKDIA